MEELLKELKESRDKVIHQDQAAKAALQQMQKELTYRLEQVELGPCQLERLHITFLTQPLSMFIPSFI